MDDAPGVGGGQPRDNLRRVIDGATVGKAAPTKLVAERLSFEQLRDDKRLVVMRADVVDDENVRVVEGGRGARFLLKLPQRVRAGRRGEHFDGDVPLQARIARAVHFAHPPGTNDAEDLVRTEPRAGGERHAYRRDYTPAC